MTIIGHSPKILAAIELVDRLAPSMVPILIVGDTGTGKELFAERAHERSGRRGPLITVDCGALPGELMESLLFGHRRGAFTGAVEHVEGLIAQAAGGTLLLDELGSLPVQGQVKLLRVLERQEVRRLGSARARPVDFRLVATVQRDVTEKVHDGSFRFDLLQRVSGAVVSLPSLAERVEDIPALARHFAAEAGVLLSIEAEALLEARAWPGNVRELRWAVVRAALTSLEEGRVVSGVAMREALAAGVYALLDGTARRDALAELAATCRVHGGDAAQIADALGIARSTLYRRLREAGLELRAFKRGDAACR